MFACTASTSGESLSRAPLCARRLAFPATSAPSSLRPPLLGALCGGLLAGLAIAAGVGSEPGAHPALRAIDGDTLVLGEDRIRIADIDAPEPHGRCPAERALARAATAHLEALLVAGPVALRSAGRDEDRYGRKLRIVTHNGRSLGDALVAAGLARRWTGRRARWCAGPAQSRGTAIAISRVGSQPSEA